MRQEWRAFAHRAVGAAAAVCLLAVGACADRFDAYDFVADEFVPATDGKYAGKYPVFVARGQYFYQMPTTFPPGQDTGLGFYPVDQYSPDPNYAPVAPDAPGIVSRRYRVFPGFDPQLYTVKVPASEARLFQTKPIPFEVRYAVYSDLARPAPNSPPSLGAADRLPGSVQFVLVSQTSTAGWPIYRALDTEFYLKDGWYYPVDQGPIQPAPVAPGEPAVVATRYRVNASGVELYSETLPKTEAERLQPKFVPFQLPYDAYVSYSQQPSAPNPGPSGPDTVVPGVPAVPNPSVPAPPTSPNPWVDTSRDNGGCQAIGPRPSAVALWPVLLVGLVLRRRRAPRA